MELIYQHVHVPAGLIFHSAPRVRTPGFRWAPATFLNAECYMRGVEKGSGYLQKGGLLIHQPGYLLEESLLFTPALNWMLQARKNRTKRKLRSRQNGQMKVSGSKLSRLRNHLALWYADPENTASQLRTRRLRNPAIIMSKTGAYGALVSGVTKRNGVWACKWQMTVEVKRAGEDYPTFFRRRTYQLGEFTEPIPCPASELTMATWLVD